MQPNNGLFLVVLIHLGYQALGNLYTTELYFS